MSTDCSYDTDSYFALVHGSYVTQCSLFKGAAIISLSVMAVQVEINDN